jgi:uncharacterized protein (DUF736 family)
VAGVDQHGTNRGISRRPRRWSNTGESNPRGRAAIGAAWSKRSSEGRDYLSVKLDDPSFTTPIYANLSDDEGGETFSLIWSRGRRSNGD